MFTTVNAISSFVLLGDSSLHFLLNSKTTFLFGLKTTAFQTISCHFSLKQICNHLKKICTAPCMDKMNADVRQQLNADSIKRPQQSEKIEQSCMHIS